MPIATFSACSVRQDNDVPEGFYGIDQENNNFDRYCKTIIKDGEAITAYKGENISIAINKDNYEVKEYIYSKGTISEDIYDLETGYKLVNVVLFNIYGEENVNIILDNNYIVDFVNISEYIEGEELKEYYTLEEIKALEP